MTFKTTTQQRDENRIFAGNDPAYTTTGASGITAATPALTPLMLDDATGKLAAWDGQKAGAAVGVLTLPLEASYSRAGSRQRSDSGYRSGRGFGTYSGNICS